MNTQTQSNNWNLLFIAWLIATASTIGSLFFSEIMELIPCVLCWYQRIFMFPLAIILLMGLFPYDPKVVRYAIPITLIGLLFTIYHCLLFYGFIPEDMQPCGKGVSCSDDGMVLFDFIPIPLLSLAAFVSITILLFRVKKSS